MGDKNPHKQPKPKKDTKRKDSVKEEIPQPELVKKSKKAHEQNGCLNSKRTSRRCVFNSLIIA